jgi:peptidoglycan hydrolase-like protein with peptidoglycan-binding domain
MGKYLTSLLILASSLLFPDDIFADEQVRRVQEELRKRHLFYADANGEKGPALTLAIRRYQEKKGFSPTGAIDSVTLASLGLSTATPSVATTPVAVGKHGQVHGANGERLPSYPPFLRPHDERVSKFDPAIIGRDYIDLELADVGGQRAQRRPTFGKRARLTSSAAERGAPFEVAFDPSSKRIDHASENRVWSMLVLQPAADVSAQLALDGERVHQARINPDRRSHRRPHRVKPRKEKNPFVLTYQSVDRALRSLFGDGQAKKKRSATRRL